MRPSRRAPVSKGRSAGHFKAQTARTKAPNVAPPPMRGGYRL